jgi:ELWxxDGT repeat protein
MVKDPNPAADNNSLPCCFTDANGILYFLASDAGPVPNELWRSDGTEAGTTLVKHIRVGIFPFTAVKGKILYLSLEKGLWRSDGTPRGTTLVRGFPPSGPGHVSVGSLTAAKGTLYFVSTDKKHGEELWRSDGTRKGTKVVTDIRRGTASSHPQQLTAVGGTLFFTAKDRGHGRELWRAGPKPCKTAKGKCKKKG